MGQAVWRQKCLYDKRAVKWVFAVGDWTLRYYPPAKKCKLDSPWLGPHLVVSLAGWVDDVQLHPDSPVLLIHCQNLKKILHPRGLVSWRHSDKPDSSMTHPIIGTSMVCLSTPGPTPPQCLVSSRNSLSFGLWHLNHKKLRHCCLTVWSFYVLHSFFHHRLDAGPICLSSVAHSFKYRIAMLRDVVKPAVCIGRSRMVALQFLDNVDIPWDQQVAVMFQIVHALALDVGHINPEYIDCVRLASDCTGLISMDCRFSCPPGLMCRYPGFRVIRVILGPYTLWTRFHMCPITLERMAACYWLRMYDCRQEFYRPVIGCRLWLGGGGGGGWCAAPPIAAKGLDDVSWLGRFLISGVFRCWAHLEFCSWQEHTCVLGSGGVFLEVVTYFSLICGIELDYRAEYVGLSGLGWLDSQWVILIMRDHWSRMWTITIACGLPMTITRKSLWVYHLWGWWTLGLQSYQMFLVPGRLIPGSQYHGCCRNRPPISSVCWYRMRRQLRCTFMTSS